MIKTIRKILEEGESRDLKYPEVYYEQEMFSKGEVIKAIIKERQRLREVLDWTYKDLDMGKTIPIFIQRVKENIVPRNTKPPEYSEAVKKMMAAQDETSSSVQKTSQEDEDERS